MSRETIGNRIRSIREQKGISASQLARAARVTPTAVWNWETNGRRPHQDTLSLVAQILDVTSEFLLSGKAAPATGTATVAEIIEEARSKIAKTTGVAPASVKVVVELQPNED